MQCVLSSSSSVEELQEETVDRRRRRAGGTTRQRKRGLHVDQEDPAAREVLALLVDPERAKMRGGMFAIPSQTHIEI